MSQLPTPDHSQVGVGAESPPTDGWAPPLCEITPYAGASAPASVVTGAPPPPSAAIAASGGGASPGPGVEVGAPEVVPGYL